jgi:UrcA family protein
MSFDKLACALLVSSLSVGAVAQPTEYAKVVAQSEVRSKIVNYADLNLQRHEGVAVLYRRIQVAADFVCTEGDNRTLQVVLRVRNCVSDATTRAVTQTGMPALAALHAQHTAKGPTTEIVARASR